MNITTIEQIEEAMKAELSKAGVEAEVTIRDTVMIYIEGEELKNENLVLDIMKQTGREDFTVSRYDAEEGLEAGATFSFKM